MKLNQAVIESFSWNGKTLDVRWCSEVKGFGVRCYKSGRKCYVLGYEEFGKYRVRTIASVSDMTFREARIEAESILYRHRKRSKLRQEFGPPKRFSEIASQWIENYAKQHRSTWKRDEERLKLHILPAIGDDSLTRIPAIKLIQLHSKISDTAPIQANRTLRLIGTIINTAKRWGMFEGMNPVDAVKMNKERIRERWVKPEEIPALMKAIENESNIYARSAILLYLLTGLRRSEVLNIKWEDIDFERKVLTVPKNKTNRTYFVNLSSKAIEVIQSTPRIKNNPYLICGSNPGEALVNIKKPWNRIRKEANLPDVTIHDLRRTVGSWLAQSNYSLHLVGKALNHTSVAATSRYAHFQRETVANALEEHGNKLFSLIKSPA